MSTEPNPFIVYWSEEDGCFVGRCPGLFYGGTHGDDPEAVLRELREIAQEVIEDLRAHGKPLPEGSEN